MDKEIVIILTARQWFAITHGGIRKHGRRKAFGAGNLSSQIDDQLKKEITQKQYEDLKKEWLSLASMFPAETQKKNKIARKQNP
jgi:phenylalanine-4-hydroxylase